MKIFKYLMLTLNVLLLFVITVIAFINSDMVEFNYYFAKKELPFSVALAIAFSLGVLITAPYFWLKAWYFLRANKGLKKKIADQEKKATEERIKEQFLAEKEEKISK